MCLVVLRGLCDHGIRESRTFDITVDSDWKMLWPMEHPEILEEFRVSIAIEPYGFVDFSAFHERLQQAEAEDTLTSFPPSVDLCYAWVSTRLDSNHKMHILKLLYCGVGMPQRSMFKQLWFHAGQ